MDRSQRIAVVRAAAWGVGWLVMGFFVIPGVAIFCAPNVAAQPDAESMIDAMASFSRVAMVANFGALVAFVIALGCFGYIAVVAAKAFIGPENGPSDNPSNNPSKDNPSAAAKQESENKAA